MGSDECYGQYGPVEKPYLVLNSEGEQICPKQSYLSHAHFMIKEYLLKGSGDNKLNEEFIILDTETLEVFTYRNNVALLAAHSKESKPHVHANLIIKWAVDGVDIQSRYTYEKDGERVYSEWEDDKFPLWNKNFEYRVKPA